jgi:ketosteroid isomerase-like protein
MYDPDLIWDWSHFEGWLDEPVMRGFDELRRGFVTFRDMWGDFVAQPSELRDFGEKQMLACNLRVVGSGSGAVVEQTWWQVVYVRDGLIAQITNYSDRRDALDAVKLFA